MLRARQTDGGAAICSHRQPAVCRCACAAGVYSMRAVIGGGPAGSSVWCDRGSLSPGPGAGARSPISPIRRLHLAAPLIAALIPVLPSAAPFYPPPSPRGFPPRLFVPS